MWRRQPESASEAEGEVGKGRVMDPQTLMEARRCWESGKAEEKGTLLGRRSHKMGSGGGGEAARETQHVHTGDSRHTIQSLVGGGGEEVEACKAQDKSHFSFKETRAGDRPHLLGVSSCRKQFLSLRSAVAAGWIMGCWDIPVTVRCLAASLPPPDPLPATTITLCPDLDIEMPSMWQNHPWLQHRENATSERHSTVYPLTPSGWHMDEMTPMKLPLHGSTENQEASAFPCHVLLVFWSCLWHTEVPRPQQWQCQFLNARPPGNSCPAL